MRKLLTLMTTVCACVLAAAPLSLDEARERALAANLSLQAQQAGRDAAAWNYRESLFGLLPSASLDGGYTRYDPVLVTGYDDNAVNYGLTVSMPLLAGGAKWLGSRMQHDALLMADQNLLAKRLEIIAGVEGKYYTVLETAELLRNAENTLAVSQTNLENAQVKFDSGALSRADLLQLQANAASNEVTVIQRRNAVQLAMLDLANYLQLPADFTLEPVSFDDLRPQVERLRALDAAAADALADRLVNEGAATSPSLRVAELSRSTSEKSVWMARGAFLPTLTLAYSKTWTNDSAPADDYEDQSTLMLKASLPLFPVANNYSAERSASRSLHQANLTLASTDDSVRLGLRSAVLSLITAARTVHSSEIALSYAQETYTQMEERFSAGQINANDLLSAETLLLSSQNLHTTSLYDFLRARSTLAQQMGVGENDLQNRF